jgi:hypothetical protein
VFLEGFVLVLDFLLLVSFWLEFMPPLNFILKLALICRTATDRIYITGRMILAI